MRVVLKVAVLVVVMLGFWQGWEFCESVWMADNSRDPEVRQAIRQQQIEDARHRGDESAVRALETWDEDMERWNREARATSQPAE